MGDAAEVEDARVALTLIDASRYEPVTFAPWEDDGEKVTRARWLDVFRAATPSSRDARRRAVRQTPSRARQSFSASSTPCATRARDAPWTRNRRDRRDGRVGTRRRGAGEAVARRRCLELCRARDGILRACGFVDCFASVKREENDRALGALPDVLRALDETAGADEDAVGGVRRACSRGTYSISAPHRRWTCMKMVAVSISRRRWRDSGRDRGASTISTLERTIAKRRASKGGGVRR